MGRKEFNIEFYTKEEIKKLIKNKEHLYFADNGIDEVIVREQDIPDFIVSVCRNIGQMDLKFYDMNSPSLVPILSTYGEFLNKVDLKLREKIIERLIQLQIGEKKPKKIKVIDENLFEEVRKTMIKNKEKRNNDAR